MEKNKEVCDRQYWRGVGIVIDKASLEREWIMKLRNERFPKRDPGIIEKAIYALTLLEEF